MHLLRDIFLILDLEADQLDDPQQFNAVQIFFSITIVSVCFDLGVHGFCALLANK